MQTLINHRSLLFLLLFFPALSMAGWPIFSVPSIREVNSIIQHQDCAQGEGKIAPGTRFPFKVFNETWYWEYKGNSTCHTLPSNLQYIAYKEEGNTSGHRIITSYGFDQHSLFQFVLLIPYCTWDQNCKWFCGPLSSESPPTLLSCAYDE